MRFGWYVVGTTVGGNAVVVGESDDAVYFADHSWYGDDQVCYQVLAEDGRWVELPLTAEAVRRSLFALASSVDEYLVRSTAIDEVLDRVD